jgi:hypothetical protein
MVLAVLICVIAFGALYLVAERFVHLSREVEYEVTLVDDDEEEDGAW